MIFGLALGLTTFTSCDKESSTLLDRDTMNGDIVDDTYVISNQQIQQNTTGVVVRKAEEDEYGLQVDFLNDSEGMVAVDYTSYSVLGIKASGNCDVQFQRNVQFNDTDSIVNYTVVVNQQGGCEKLETSSNWVLVPQVPNGYDVEFEVVTKTLN